MHIGPGINARSDIADTPGNTFAYVKKPSDKLGIMSRKHALEIFRGPLPPQRNARKDDCLSASARVSSLHRSEEAQGRKTSSVRRARDFQRSHYVVFIY
ncbi:MAG: hypothetical protein D4R56_06070 [Deltaproteobacteria bacterium]|nr:MAG: hypothetical protein D4R56_06070 [Deltaproteobacteria bacterium]